MSRNRILQNRTLAISLQDAYQDFILSRKAKRVSDNMLKTYQYTFKKFIPWLEKQGIDKPDDITSRDVRGFLAEIAQSGVADNTLHIHARNIKTLVRFFHKEKYASDLVYFDMPKVEKKKLSFLQPDQIPIVLDACENLRNRALVLFMIDTGLRRSEICDLNWGDIDIKNGTVVVRRGKGKKFRSVGIGIKTCRALLAYGRSFPRNPNDPVFLTLTNYARIKPEGIRSFISRLSKNVGIDLSPHSMRRTFCTLCYKAGMSLVDIQGLMGHSSIEMTRNYIQALTDDYIEGHKKFGPIDTFL